MHWQGAIRSQFTHVIDTCRRRHSDRIHELCTPSCSVSSTGYGAFGMPGERVKLEMA